MTIESRKTSFCEKESSVVAAVIAGAISDDLRIHIDGCAVCAEVVAVCQLLANEVATAPKEARIPDASVVWRRAQRLSRQQATAKATEPIRVVCICACVAAAVALPWAGFSFLDSSSWLPDLARYSGTMDHTLAAVLTGTSLLGIIGGMVIVSLSSWYVLRQE